MTKKIGVVGLGKLGLCTALCFSSAGYKVVGIDTSEKVVQMTNNKESHITEPLVNEYLEKYPVLASTNYGLLADTDYSFIIVPTPSLEDGGFDDSHVRSAIAEIKKVVKKKHIICVVSTVSPGAMRKIINMHKRSNIRFVYNPEFIALGSVIRDFLNPDSVLIGCDEYADANEISQVYASTCENDPSFEIMSVESAEIAKIALNSYVTLKISYANFLSQVCDKSMNVNVDDVTRFLGNDSRIGKKYLRGGSSYGGPCFPRDNRAFYHHVRKLKGVNGSLLCAIDNLNEQHQFFIEQKVLSIVKKNNVRSVVLFGYSYKLDTFVDDESSGKKLFNMLKSKGLKVLVYADVKSTISSLLNRADLAVFMLPYDFLSELKPNVFLKNMRKPVVFDVWRVAGHLKNEKRIQYHSLGEGL